MTYSWLIDGLDTEHRKNVDDLLYEVPAGSRDEVFLAQPEWDPNEMGANFMAQMGMRGGQGRAQTGASLQTAPVRQA